MGVLSSVGPALSSLDGLSATCVIHPWGTVTRDSALPLVHDANHAWVVAPPYPSLDELRDALRAVQAAAPVPFTQVELLDVTESPTLTAELTAWLGQPELFAVMAVSSAQPRAARPVPAGMTVTQQPFPDLERWLTLVDAGHADEPRLPDDVLRQLATRDTSVFAPAGRRFFTAEREGEVIAYASLLSLEGIGVVDNVATVPEHRRQGAATAVVSAAVAASVRSGNEHTILFTRDGGDAVRVYERLGFRAIARAAQFHGDHHEP